MAEFEKNVKMETAISNVSGTALWVVDESRKWIQRYLLRGTHTNNQFSDEGVRSKRSWLR